MQKTKSVRCNIHINSWNKTPDLTLPSGTYTLVLDYPLSTKAKFPITVRKTMGFAALVSKIVECYREVYKKEEEWEARMKKRFTLDEDPPYGIYGHDIGDLVIEGINIDYVKKRITLYTGS